MGAGSSGGFYDAARCFELGRPLPADVLQQSRERSPWLGRSDRFAPDAAAVCEAFIPPSTDHTVLPPVHSDIPTVIFAGEFDPTTPPEYGRRAAATLPNAHLLVLPGKGHDVKRSDPMHRADPPGLPRRSAAGAGHELRRHAAPARFRHERARERGCAAAPLARRDCARAGLGGRYRSRASFTARGARGPASELAGRPPNRAGARRRDRNRPALGGGGHGAPVFRGGAVALWTAGDPYVPLFGVPDRWRWLFALPPIALLFAAGGVLAVGLSWRRHRWSRRERLLHAVVAAASLAFVLLVGRFGMLPSSS
jgi:hypothetical protein